MMFLLIAFKFEAETEKPLLDAPLDARPAGRPPDENKYILGFSAPFFLAISPKSKKMMNIGNLFSSILSSICRSPPPSPKGLPRAEMMFPRHTLERGEPSRVPNEDRSSEEEEAPNVEFANRGLMIEVQDLYRYRHFQDKDIVGWSYIEALVLNILGIQEEFERIMSQPFWRHICSWRDATYTPIVREFISTLEVNEGMHNRRQPSIKFKLFHRQYDISSDELGNLLGFYTLHDRGQRWYENLVDDFINEHQPELFWWGIARPGIAWRASYTSAKYIKVPELKIIWHIIARSWLERQTLNDNVTRRELFMLWTMYTETPIHMGELCKTFLKRQSYEDSESDFIQFGVPPEESSDDEARDEQRELWGTIERLENRVNMLEHEVRRLTLDRYEEESDGWGTIERLENRVNMLEHEVRRLTLDRYEEESDGSGE
nr:uncharacterized protein LOC112422231 [Ipomoea batatas]